MPSCLSACPPLTDCLHVYLSFCMGACVFLCLSDYLSVSFSCVQASCVFVPVCVCMCVQREAHAVPQGSGSRLGDSTADNRSFWKITGPCPVPSSLSVSPLHPAPVLNLVGKVGKAIKLNHSLFILLLIFFSYLLLFHVLYI